MRGHEAARCRKDRSLAIALNASSFQNEVQMRLINAFDDTLFVEMSVYLVVQFGRELLAPAVETEIEKDV